MSKLDPIEELKAHIESETIPSGDWRTRLKKPPLVTFPADKSYFWHMDTSEGSMKFRLFTDSAPMHASSTIYLTLRGFYDGLGFHRVISGFMAQGGCPEGSGRGNPGYQYDGEFKGSVSHDKKGLLSMANAGPGTDGSQFFITFVPTPHLNGNHTIFGELVEGEDVLKALEAAGSRSGTPAKPLEIRTATISQD